MGWLKTTFLGNQPSGSEFKDVMTFQSNSDFSDIQYKGRFYVGIAGAFKFFMANPYEKTTFMIDG